MRGVVRFSTESFKTQLNPMTCHTERKKSIVIYKNQNAKNEEEEEEEKRKKEIELYEVTLSPARFKNKQFKVELPITRGPKSVKASKANDLYFTFNFSNSDGTSAPTQAGLRCSTASTKPRPSSSTPIARRPPTTSASSSNSQNWTTARRRLSAISRLPTAATPKTDCVYSTYCPPLSCYNHMLRTVRTCFGFAVQSYNPSKNYYKVLNVEESATPDRIKASFKSLAKRYHPDFNKGKEEEFK